MFCRLTSSDNARNLNFTDSSADNGGNVSSVRSIVKEDDGDPFISHLLTSEQNVLPDDEGERSSSAYLNSFAPFHSHRDTQSNFVGHGTGSGSVPGYASSNQLFGSSHGYNLPKPFAGYGRPSYPELSRVDGSFNHAFRGDYGIFAPDFYSPYYDVRALSVVARDMLHRYRYREVSMHR